MGWTHLILLLKYQILFRSSAQVEKVRKQLLVHECKPYPRPQFEEAWLYAQELSLTANSALASASLDEGLSTWIEILHHLIFDHYYASQECPVLTATWCLEVARWCGMLGKSEMARRILQVGNMYKLTAISRWYTQFDKAHSPMVYEPRMQIAYTMYLQALQEKLMVQPKQLSVSPRRSTRWEITSICNYKPDPTSNTGDVSTLPLIAPPNHRTYALKHDVPYFLHENLHLPNMEAHYSKMHAVLERLRTQPQIEWMLFIDCDAFFTNFDIHPHDIVDAYGTLETEFLVAEDTGGINTGVFMIKNSPWSHAFLQRVAQRQQTTAWDQSMFFTEIVQDVFTEQALYRESSLPAEVSFVHQAHLNAFVPPASRDWQAYEWQPGDYVRHFAGCPWQEVPCLTMMNETAAMMAERMRTDL